MHFQIRAYFYHVLFSRTRQATDCYLSLQNVTKSAKGTKENPGANVSQRSGLNRTISCQCGSMISRLLKYKLAGYGSWVVAAHTSRTYSVCGFTDNKNGNGCVLLCLSCQYLAHADQNAARNIEDARICNLGRPARCVVICRHFQYFWGGTTLD